VLKGIAMFETAPLLGRKLRQFRAWRPGAEAFARAVLAREPVDAEIVRAARRDLARATAYHAPRSPLPGDAGWGATRIAYIDVLRAWARFADGPLTCTAYQVARRRRPDWPKRETIALAFGGWYEALRSAGLDHRAARRPSAG
jgi:hypothetical protein